VDVTVRQLVATGDLEPDRHAAVVATLRVLGHQLDVVDRDDQSRAAAFVSRALTDLLEQVGAIPSPSRSSGEVDRLLAELVGE
jgi:hypothetical protein